MSKRFGVGTLLALCLLGNATGAETLKLGLNLELTGSLPVGVSSRNGIELAVEELNAAGGMTVQGHTYTFETNAQDNQSNPDQAVRITEQFIADKVLAMVGPNASGNAIPAAEKAESGSLLMISPWSTHVKTTENKTWVFRAAFTDDYQGIVMSKFARTRLNAKKAAVLFNAQEAHNKEIADFFRNDFESQGGEVTAYESYTPGTADYTLQNQAILASGAEVLFLPNYYTEVPEQVKQLRAQGYRGAIIGTDAWGVPELFALGSDFLEGAYFSAHYAADIATAKAQAFVQKYQARYNAVPDDVAALSYDSIGLLAAALRQAAGPSSAEVREALSRLPLYEGVTGSMKFLPGSGTPVKNAVILRIANGKFVYFDTAGPVGPSFVPSAGQYR